ncbi:hypothetical protein MaudCBS49596_003047 [Microsporum audouinii]
MRSEKKPAKESLASRHKRAKLAVDVRRDSEGQDREETPMDDKDCSIPDTKMEEAGQGAKDAQISRDLDTMKLIFQEAARYAATEKDKDKAERFEDTSMCSMLAACSNRVLSKIYALREVVTSHAGGTAMRVEDMKLCEELCNILTREE